MIRLERRYKWVVTGAAGFIGSHIVQKLLYLNQEVIGIDDLSATRNSSNLSRVSDHKNFRFFLMNVGGANLLELFKGVDFVLHQAAIGSVPRSLKYPEYYFYNNCGSMAMVLEASRKCGIKKVVYASSSSVYGDSPSCPKRDDVVTSNFQALSPYGFTKQVNEQQARSYDFIYGTKSVGLRYFNVFGPRQNPDSPYSAVIPLWIKKILKNEPIDVNGDGSQFRDFNYVENIVDYNILSAVNDTPDILNVCSGQKTSLLELVDLIRESIKVLTKETKTIEINYKPEREGDIKFSYGSTDLLDKTFPNHKRISLKDGIHWTVGYYINEMKKNAI